MSVTKDDVRKVARLSRIAVSEQHVGELVGELNGILSWIDQLNEVVTDGDIQDQVLANAPRTEDGFFVVPKAVE